MRLLGILLALMFCAPAHAQDRGSLTVPPHAKNGILIPKDAKPSKKIFWLGTAALASAETFDSINTRRMLNAGGSESHPFFGPHPSPARQAATAGALFGAEATIFHFTERSRHWYVRWPGRVGLGYMVAVHIQGGLSTAAYARQHSH